jgi:hypothetical protein
MAFTNAMLGIQQGHFILSKTRSYIPRSILACIYNCEYSTRYRGKYATYQGYSTLYLYMSISSGHARGIPFIVGDRQLIYAKHGSIYHAYVGLKI